MVFFSRSFSIKNILFYVCFICILFCGTVLRTCAWINGFDFFFDEAALCVNLEDNNFFGFFFPLSYGQCCPPLFMFLSKLVFNIFGFSEIHLRFIPFLSSICSLFLFSYLAFKIFKSKFVILLSTFLFSVSQWVIIYTMFFKPYMSDIFCSLLVLIMAIRFKDLILSKGQIFICLFFSIVICLFSYPSMIVLINAILVLFLYNFFKNYKTFFINNKNLNLIFLYIFPFLGFLVLYFYFHCFLAVKNDYLQYFWGVLAAKMFPENFFDIQQFLYFLSADFVNLLFLSILFIISFILTFKKDKFLFGLFFGVFFFSGLLGFFHIYPFTPERISLYLIPIFILFVCKSLDYINLKNKLLYGFIMFCIVLCLFDINKIFHFVKLHDRFLLEDIVHYKYLKMYQAEKTVSAKRLIEFLPHTDYSKQDFLYCKYSNFLLFDFLDKRHLINHKNIIYVLKDFGKIPKNSFVYFYTSENFDNSYPEILQMINSDYKTVYSIQDGDYFLIKARKIK
jgi:hypothetical protein